MKTPLIIQYTNLLHRFQNIDASLVEKFLKEHLEDKIFIRRVYVLNKIFKLKLDLLNG